MNKNIAIGADIGGSHISCAAVNLDSGLILKDSFAQFEVNNKASADLILANWADALKSVILKVPDEEIKGIGFAMPGPFDYVNGVCYIRGVAKYENLYGLNIRSIISERIHVPEEFLIRFINDASAFAAGEAWAGSASGAKRSLSITLGTGFGSAFINNRIPVVDGPDVPGMGCVYHIPYKDGIADDYFSTRWFINSYRNITGRELSGVKELAELAATDRTAVALFSEFGDNMGLFLAPWLKRFKAEIIVIGGNISQSYNLFGEIFEQRLKAENCHCSVALSKLKEEAALLGAACLLDNDFWSLVQNALPLM